MTKKKTHSSLCNPVMFSVVMKDEELFRELLSRILPDRKIRSLRFHDCGENEISGRSEAFLQTEQTIVINPYAKAVRFDVLFEEENIWYDVEVQASDTRSLPQRSRYYHGAAAVDSLARGQEYRELKPGYVIFICLFDLFGMDQPIYSFEMYDRKNRLLLQDGQFTIFLNTACRKEDVPEGLKNLFLYLEEDTVVESDPWISRLQNVVRSMEQEKEVRNKMTLYEEWVRTACTMEKIKKSLEAAETQLKSIKQNLEAAEIQLKSKEQDLETAETQLKSREQDLETAETQLKSKEQDLETTKSQLKSTEQDLEAANARIKELETETGQPRFETMMRLLLEQGRTEDMRKALDDADYRELLFKELSL